jgi:hypothetical protein
MSDTEVQVKFGADTSALKTAMDDVKAQVGGVSAAVGGLAGSLKAVGAQGSSSVAELKTFKKEWDGAVNPMVSSFTHGLLQMAEGTKTLRQGLLNIGQSIVNDFISKVINPMVERWIWGEVIKSGVTSSESMFRQGVQAIESLFGITTGKAAAVANVGASAAAAGAAGVASAAAIPIVGWSMAPAAGATDAAAALSFGSLAVAEGGWGDVPFDGAFAQLHKQEMVLPATLANPMRQMLGDYASTNAPAAADDGGGGGDTHLHLHMGAGADGPSLQRWFDSHGDKIAKTLSAQTRRGANFT